MSSEQIQLFITSPLRYILKMRKKEQKKLKKTLNYLSAIQEKNTNSGSIFVGKGD